ncbi:uncharacterized protein PgNI_00689 [Pyricularia grisea]|uniref:Uncharacterized protein n=1 Tax=Pyricularia grisea TaxID=148305 RepID=A0A6P8BJ68_PYRGI|nr:uncharacterized protein PgNI_00689 [Pyricularia grisea]TLD16627.1 hypothetical protein PgNI_00689 [Pyricularia grisea]
MLCLGHTPLHANFSPVYRHSPPYPSALPATWALFSNSHNYFLLADNTVANHHRGLDTPCPHRRDPGRNDVGCPSPWISETKGMQNMALGLPQVASVLVCAFVLAGLDMLGMMHGAVLLLSLAAIPVGWSTWLIWWLDEGGTRNLASIYHELYTVQGNIRRVA